MIAIGTETTTDGGNRPNGNGNYNSYQGGPVPVETQTDHAKSAATSVTASTSTIMKDSPTATSSTAAASSSSSSPTTPLSSQKGGKKSFPAAIKTDNDIGNLYHRRVASESGTQQQQQQQQQQPFPFFPPPISHVIYNNNNNNPSGQIASGPVIDVGDGAGYPPVPPLPSFHHQQQQSPNLYGGSPTAYGNPHAVVPPPFMMPMMPPPPGATAATVTTETAANAANAMMYHQMMIMMMQQQQQQQQQQQNTAAAAPFFLPQTLSNTAPPHPSSTMQQGNIENNSKSQGAQHRSTISGKRKQVPGHRRVHSYSGAGWSDSGGSASGGSYGSLGDFYGPGPGGMPPLPPQRFTSERFGGGGSSNGARSKAGGGDFSPRAEFRKLVASSSASPVVSPRQSASRSRSPMTTNSSMSAGSGNIPSFPLPPTHGRSDSYSSVDDGMSAMLPPRPPNRGVYTGLEDDGQSHGHGPAIIIPPSPRTAGSLRKLEQGGEAAFLVKSERCSNNDGQYSSKKHHRRGSQRKMHMRQKSAQLFMESVKGEEQLPSCRDIAFLLLFVFHLLGIVYLGRTYGYESSPTTMVNDDPHDSAITTNILTTATASEGGGDDDDLYSEDADDSAITLKIMNLVYLASLSGAFAVVVSALTLFLMMSVATKLVQIALFLAIALSFAWGTMGVGLSPTWVVPATGLIALAFSVAYAFIVWDRIPFAASNLDSGLTGIKTNPGMILIAFVFQLLALGWSIYFTFVVVGVYDAVQIGDLGSSWAGKKYVIFSLLGISYYWTLHVFLNIVQVTVAGVIGNWWYKSDDDTSTRAASLKMSFFRSCFYSIGSICFGSLVVGPVRVLRQLSAFFRPSPESSSLLCLHQCAHFAQTYLTSCVEALGDRFSPWSFTYVGLYGYGLIDAGLHASELFETRGWTKIVTDDLVPNVLFLISLVIGGVTGLFAYVIEGFEMLSISSLGVPDTTSFMVGSLVGLVVSSVLFGIISSSVNAVICLFAASPADFQQNHPKLSMQMSNSWREVWPGCIFDPSLQLNINGGGGYLSERHPLLP